MRLPTSCSLSIFYSLLRFAVEWANVIKPDPEIYKLCLNRNNLTPEESVFIDDNLENVIAASKIGMHAIHFINAEQLQSSLLNLNVKL